MQSGITIAKRFMIVSAFSVALILVLNAVAFFAARSFGDHLSSITDDSIPSLDSALSIANDASLLRGDYWKHMSSNQPADMDKVEEEIRGHNAALEAHIADYRKTIDDNDEDRGNLALMVSAIADFREQWKLVYPLSRAGKTDEAVALFNKIARPKFQEVQGAVAKVVAYDRRVAGETSMAARSSASRSLLFSMGIGLLAVAISIGISWFMISGTNKVLRQSSQELSDGAEQVANAADMISASSQSLAQGASEQAASIEETSAATTEINSMAQRNTQNARDTAEIVAHSESSFQQTNRHLDALLAAMAGIDDSSQKISKIIKVIDEIAFQTNILALNAAVEAARAGEAGMGFAVVADEVRNLAQRSAQAAKDTAILIEDSIGKSADGKAKVDQVAKAVRSTVTDSGRMKTLIDEIYMGSSEQAKGIDQIGSSIQRMEQVTQAAAATAEETAAATEELNAQAHSMKDVVSRLSALVDGAAVGPRESKRSPKRTPLQNFRPAREANVF